MTTNKEIDRGFLPYPKFKAGQGEGEKHGRNIGPILSPQFILQTLDEDLAFNLNRAFEKDSFDEILETLAELFCVAEEGVLILDSSGENFHFHSYPHCEYTNKQYIEVGAERSNTLRNVWVFHTSSLDKKELTDFIEDEFEIIIDIKALAVWALRPDHPSYVVSVVEKKPIYLPHPIEFTVEQYKQIYDEFEGVEGAFKRSSRGLRIYNPIEKEFVKFNKKTSMVRTTASTLLFRQSYNSFYYIFEIDPIGQKILKRYYKSGSADIIGRYRDSYKDIEDEHFALFGNE